MAGGPAGRGADPRRSPGPRPSRRVGGAAATSRGPRPAAGPRRGSSRRTAAGEQPGPRPRVTGRAAVLVLVVALLLVSYASSMRAYLDQRSHLATLRASIASSQADVDRLSREQQRWQDPAYVRAVAHQRFGWVLPGEVDFQVLGDDGKPLDHTDSLSAPGSTARSAAPVWWQSAWGSVVAAGRPVVHKRALPRPATRIGVSVPQASGQ